MTIELGHVWADVDGRRVAVVDVPGHDRLVGTTLAGLGPVAGVLLVVAADEGWRAQTEEHVAAVRALGLTDVALVVTRADLADPGPATADALARLAAHGIRPVAVAAASARTGAGLDDVRAALAALADRAPAGDPQAPVRLWVDRSFTVTGSGTVVTGTLPTGTVTRGGTLVLDGAAGAGARPAGARRAGRRRRPGPPGWPSTCAPCPPPTCRAAARCSPPAGRRRPRWSTSCCTGSSTGCRRTPPCTSAPPPHRCGCGRWAATTPGSPSPTVRPPSRSSPATGWCCATPARTRCSPARPCSTPIPRRCTAVGMPCVGPLRSPPAPSPQPVARRPARRRPPRTETVGAGGGHPASAPLAALLAWLDEHPLEPAPRRAAGAGDRRPELADAERGRRGRAPGGSGPARRHARGRGDPARRPAGTVLTGRRRPGDGHQPAGRHPRARAARRALR